MKPSWNYFLTMRHHHELLLKGVMRLQVRDTRLQVEIGSESLDVVP